MGNTQGHRAHWTGAHWRGRGLPAETTGKGNGAHQNLFSCRGVYLLVRFLLLRQRPKLLGIRLSLWKSLTF
jgi:hypothetical protein